MPLSQNAEMFHADTTKETALKWGSHRSKDNIQFYYELTEKPGDI